MMLKKLLLAALLYGMATPVNAQSFTRTDRAITVNTSTGVVELQFYSSGIVHVLKSPLKKMQEPLSLSVIAKPVNASFSVKQAGQRLTITTKALKINVDINGGTISYYNLTGKLLMAERVNGNHSNEGIKQEFSLPTKDAIYGLGQHQEGVMNYRNHAVTLRQQNMEIAVPVLLSSGGYGIFWDNASATRFQDQDGITSFESAAGDVVNYYFIDGGNADGVIAGQRKLTGNAPMFPKWVFGFWQSRERYTSQQELVGVVKKYRDLHVPLDGIVQDWQYWGKGDSVWNAVDFGNPLYPNPKAMVDSVHQLNAHIIISVWPNFGPQTKIYKEFKEKRMLFDFKTWPEDRSVKVYDAFNPAARDVYWKYINKNLLSKGIDGWWLDATEPEQGNPAQSDSAQTYLGKFKTLRNAYPLATTGGIYEHQRQTIPNKRVFILTRSAYAGQQRYGTMTWSGDIQGTWDVLRKQISGGLNFSLSGIPYWNTDIGGFYSGTKYPKGVADPAFQELYTRWFEFAAFTPMFRSHGTNTPREIYQFGKKGDWAYDAQEKFINLRYRLQPYIYSSAWQVTAHSSTMMRALAMDFPSDTSVLNINNQYLFGKAILVAPVTDSLYVSRANGNTIVDFNITKSQNLYLPKGSDWVDFWTGQSYQGGKKIQAKVPIDQIPLFVKAGSIIPFGSLQQYTEQHADDKLEIRIYPGADGSFTLYEDENDGYNYEHGIYSLIDFKWNDKAHTLTISNRQGTFPSMLKTRIFNISIVAPGKTTGINTLVSTYNLNYNGKQIIKVIK
ncbi:TIM-barrel domain-containing protein [Mucilaginibacter jinjuensis]|uniref:Glycoside hydrolase family 31 protein n=1 Tax=Mucilaginibacter jinjuensis TaxID=1176721 RepID=A0ABY7T1V2_9SPHI|nr:TIM-barrel domain-containing protein [Mucilaginibacter jinjuensis]WCT10430.1 glycoside hydrolase family 31 protein [Mucilaginibacter jinjuensis]